MVCLTCGRIDRDLVCRRCEEALRSAADRFVPGVGLVRAAFHHTGPARTLVHHLKYRGVVAAGRVLAEAMAPHVPPGVVLVPVPRVGWRRLRYGVDPAVELARSLGRITSRPVVHLLAAPFWGRPRAGRSHGTAPPFRRRRGAFPDSVVLVDDVVTSGATLMAASRLLSRVEGAITATSSGRVGRFRATDAELTSVPGGGHHRE